MWAARRVAQCLQSTKEGCLVGESNTWLVSEQNIQMSTLQEMASLHQKIIAGKRKISKYRRPRQQASSEATLQN